MNTELLVKLNDVVSGMARKKLADKTDNDLQDRAMDITILSSLFQKIDETISKSGENNAKDCNIDYYDIKGTKEILSNPLKGRKSVVFIAPKSNTQSVFISKDENEDNKHFLIAPGQTISLGIGEEIYPFYATGENQGLSIIELS